KASTAAPRQEAARDVAYTEVPRCHPPRVGRRWCSHADMVFGMGDDNPYAAPQSDLAVPIAWASELPAASRNQRFLNALIDEFVLKGVQFGLESVIAAVAVERQFAITGMRRLIIEIVLSLAYYIILEGATGRTIGKMATGTQVVDEGGGRPTFGQI